MDVTSEQRRGDVTIKAQIITVMITSKAKCWNYSRWPVAEVASAREWRYAVSKVESALRQKDQHTQAPDTQASIATRMRQRVKH